MDDKNKSNVNSDIEEKAKSLSELQEEKLRAAYARKKRRKRIKSLIGWLIVIVIFAVLFIMYTQYQADRAAKLAEANKTITKETTVYETEYSVTIDISGYVEAYDIQEAKFRSTGSVTGVYVEEGDEVKKGQLLASIDNTSQEASLQSIRNQIEEAELNGSQKQLELLRLQEKNALNNLDYTNIYANFDGIITSVDVSAGDYFEAGSSTVLTLVDISKLKAKVEVDEIDMQYVKEGMEADLTFDSMPGHPLKARISYVPMLGRYSSSGIGVVDVELTIDDPPENLIPGFSFEGNINVDGQVKMLIVPQAAVKTERGGATSVRRKTSTGEEKVNVSVKYLGENLVQIVSDNIKAGDILIYDAKSNSNSMMPFMR